MIEMPSTAMTMANASRTVMITSSWLIWPSWLVRNSALVCTLACGNGAMAALTAASAAAGVTPSASLPTTMKSLDDVDGTACWRVSREISQLPASDASS